MEKILFRKLILDISLRALIITFTIGLIVWIIQAANYLEGKAYNQHNRYTSVGSSFSGTVIQTYNFTKSISF